MRAEEEFLADLVARQWSPDAGHGFQSVGLFLGNGAHAVEVAVARFGSAPARTALLQTCARLYGLTEAQLVHVFETFHEGWEYQVRLDGVLRYFRRGDAR